MEFIRDYWSQIIVLLGAIVAAVKMNSLLQILRRDVDTLDKDIKRRDTYVETVKLRAEVDQLNKNVSSLWEQINKMKDK
jgi:cell division protein FtsB|tara:strand:+ start:242 stop:478 length:237 start_codon:yes stop_codon:yes gene_type:complete